MINFLKFTRIYFFTGLGALLIAQVYFIANAGMFFNPPLTGGLIVWTHLHTMGVITPFFMGIGWYNLRHRFNIGFSGKHILFQYILLYVSLVFFLYFVSERAGSPMLSLSAVTLFFSGFYFLVVSAYKLIKFGKADKRNRDMEFWGELASLYFLLQVLMFGAVLALNLSYGFLRRDEILSLKLHSHSGITGYWLLQLILLFYRLVKDSNVTGGEVVLKGKKWVKFSMISIWSGLFLWTSVHDRFKWIFYLYIILAGLSLSFLAVFYISAEYRNAVLKEFFRNSIVFAFGGFIIAIVLVSSGDTDIIYNHHIPFIYAFLIFYGVFMFVPAVFISGQMNPDIQKSGLLVWAYRFYLKILVLAAVSVYYEKLVFLQVFMTGAMIFMGICYYLINDKYIKDLKNS